MTRLAVGGRLTAGQAPSILGRPGGAGTARAGATPGKRCTMARHRLLVVEDHAGVRFAFRGIFSRLGFDVTLTDSLAEGLALIDSGFSPCCLVLDLDLSDGPGELLLERVRQRGLKTRVAVCTGSMDQARLTAVARLKPDALLTKPVTLEDVWDGVCRVCGGLDDDPGTPAGSS